MMLPKYIATVFPLSGSLASFNISEVFLSSMDSLIAFFSLISPSKSSLYSANRLYDFDFDFFFWISYSESSEN
jgi:hypothetical protein